MVLASPTKHLAFSAGDFIILVTIFDAWVKFTFFIQVRPLQLNLMFLGQNSYWVIFLQVKPALRAYGQQVPKTVKTLIHTYIQKSNKLQIIN